MARIKVVFGINDLNVGGMERQFVEQARHFDKDAFEIVLVTLRQFPDLPHFYAELPSDLDVHKLHFSNFRDLKSWLELKRVLKELQPDIVVSSLFFSNTVLRVLRFFVDYCSIAREHNTNIAHTSLQKLVDKLLAHRSECIVAVSRAVALYTSHAEGIPLQKFKVIHNGIDLQKAERKLEMLPRKHELREEMKLQTGGLVFLNVSRLVPQKNHDLLLDGFSLFLRIHPESVLILVGDGGSRVELEKKIQKLGIEKNALLLGMRSDVWKFYKVADAFASTSDIEGMSNAYLEALAAGLPLVSTETGGTEELIEEGKNGFFIKERTPEGVCRALEKLAAPGQIHKLSIGSRAVAAKFDIRETVKAYEGLFRSCVAH